MNVVIPCGGMGRRLGFTGHQKCLVPTGGRPFLHWRLDQLVECGATEFVLLIKHAAGEVWVNIGTNWNGIPVEYLVDSEKHERTMWAAIKQSAKWMPGPFHVALGDVWCPIPLTVEPTPTRWVTDNSPHEPMNVDGLYLDAGLYYLDRKDAAPTVWNDKVIHDRTYQLNTKASWKEVDAYLGGLRRTG